MHPLPPLSLYVHFPWCVRKCPYCDFNSHELQGAVPEQAYVKALLADLDRDLEGHAEPRPLVSIFFGGGTPSLFSPKAFEQLLHGVAQRLAFSQDIEITLEANPGTLEHAPFADYRSLGINRLSLGVQSFEAAKLQALGRIHDGQQARQAVEQAQRAGFDNLNIDLMHGLPGQSLEDALADLRSAMALGPTHLSWYQLTREPNTVFGRYPPQLPDEDCLWAIQEAGAGLLAQWGLQYEVSAYARQPDLRSRHNLNYWTFGDFIGIGAGAHAKLTRDDGIWRAWKIRSPKGYLAATTPCAGTRHLLPDDLPFEFLMNALRLLEGVPSALFAERTGQRLTALEPALTRLRGQGLLREDLGILGTTPQGLLFLNDVLEQFLPA